MCILFSLENNFFMLCCLITGRSEKSLCDVQQACSLSPSVVEIVDPLLTDFMRPNKKLRSQGSEVGQG